jgi:hypothetical protein
MTRRERYGAATPSGTGTKFRASPARLSGEARFGLLYSSWLSGIFCMRGAMLRNLSRATEHPDRPKSRLT